VTDLEKASPGLEMLLPKQPRRTRGRGRRIEKQPFSFSERSLL